MQEEGLDGSGSAVSGNGRCDVFYLYVTGVFAVLMALIPVFRGSAQPPWMILFWAVLYCIYRFHLVPEKWKFLVAWGFLAMCYLLLHKITDVYAGPYHGEDVYRFEKELFGVLPARWLQDLLLNGRESNWYDYPLALCHSVFFAFPVIAPWLIRREKGIPAMKRAILAFAIITTAGYSVYILWPLTPPWLLGQDGVVEPFKRCTFNALQHIIPGWLIGGASGTPRAAMPSLHAGITLVMAMLLQRELGFKRSWWAWLFLILICFEIIYGAEHYITDIFFGFLLALTSCLLSGLPIFCQVD
ncbi:hypothetical protein CSA37_12825 [Candidatus Fermentibacteria bacterium]|nr:MAG: hypothetical protein CSA37_12825 [Candidatus Fermentibacteria bacterium]